MAADGGTRTATLLGRRRECQALDRLAAHVLAGGSRALVLRGDPGVGKTALLRYLAEQLAGWRIVSAAGVEWETEFAYSGLHQLCRPLLDGLEDLPLPQRAALATAFGLSSGPPPDRFLVALATLSLLAQSVRTEPLACIVDDAQWLDGPSAQVLAFVARRLGAERVALVIAARTGTGDDVLAGQPTMSLHGLNATDSRTLLLRNVHGGMDAAVVDRLVAESRGNPLALLELPRSWTAGGFGIPDGRPVAGKVEQSYVQRLGHLPPDTRLLVLAAAAEPVGDPALLQRAARQLGLDMTASAPAEDAGLLSVRRRVEFAHPLVRSAVYSAASTADRRRVHRALADATDARTDPDRRAWHRALGTAAPDEAVAAELERSAERAQARAGPAAAAAFLTRATELTPAPAVRARRALEAATASVRTGAFDGARTLLAIADDGPVDELQRAQMDLLRAQLALVSRRGNEAAPLLLAAAQRLEEVDSDLARDTYLDAFSAAQFAARLNDGVAVADLARAARRMSRANADPTPADLLLQAFTALPDDYAAAVPVSRRALAGLRDGFPATRSRPRLLWQGSVLALELWDDDSAHDLSSRHLQSVREAGALSELPLALSSFVPVLVFRGETQRAAALVEEARALQEAAGMAEAAYGALTYSAWRGLERETRELVEVKLREARSRREGIGIAVCEYVLAVLCNGRGHSDEALAAALGACADPAELVVHNWGLAELVEAATRAGRPDLAQDALHRLSSKALASGTEWALGMAARSRALLSDDGTAEHWYLDAVEHLGRARVRAELARTHLLYGEWLRTVDRGADADGRLTAAYEMFTAMGLDGFGDRARRALLAAGAVVPGSGNAVPDGLTPQEAHIARLARDGWSNPEIGEQLFLSARTVEWHLRKVFTKLGISSRRELRRVVPDPDA